MLVWKSTIQAPRLRPIASPRPVARTHATNWRRSERRAQACTAPRTVPVMSPPISALGTLSTGSVRASAAKPPMGKPRNETIQRPMRRAVLGAVVVGGEVMTWDMAVLLFLGWSVVGSAAGDPRCQQVVGVRGQVVSYEHIEELRV